MLEGNDGSGKSTQLRLIADYLTEKGKDVYATHEPSDSEYGRRIKFLVNSEEGERMSDEEWLELYTSDRYKHLADEINPALQSGKIVICDRYHFSTCVYQLKDESEWESYISQFLMPDLTFVIVVPTKIAVERLSKRPRKITVFEKEKLIEERRERYLRIAALDKNIKIIDGSKDVQGVFSQIKKELDNFLVLK